MSETINSSTQNTRYTPIKLRAVDLEDLRVIAACLQDAIIPVADIDFFADRSEFVLVTNRFCWERCADCELDELARVHSGLLVRQVRSVKLKNFRRNERNRLLSLLTIDAEIGKAKEYPGWIEFIFADNSVIRLEIDGLEILLSDFGESWQTPLRPRHDFAP